MISAHRKLIYILKQTGYRQLDSGVCSGTANYTMQNFFTDKLSELIEFSHVLNQLDLDTLNIEKFVEYYRPFLENITVYQDIHLHPELAGHKKDNAPCGVDMLVSEPLEKIGGLRQLSNCSQLNINNLYAHLYEQKEMLVSLDIDRIGFFVINYFGVEPHSIFVGYDNTTGMWTLSDANQFPVSQIDGVQSNSLNQVIHFIYTGFSKLCPNLQYAQLKVLAYLPAPDIEKLAVALCHEPDEDKRRLLNFLLSFTKDSLFFNKLFSEMLASQNRDMLHLLLARENIGMNAEQFDSFFDFVFQSDDGFLLDAVIFQHYPWCFTEEQMVEKYHAAMQSGRINVADQFLILMMREKVDPISSILSNLYSTRLPINERLMKLIFYTIEYGYEEKLKPFLSDNIRRLNRWHDQRGYSFMMCLLERSHTISGAIFLLRLGINTNYHYQGMTDLQLAIQQKDVYLVKKLLACEAGQMDEAENELKAIDFAVNLQLCPEKQEIVFDIVENMFHAHVRQYRDDILDLCERFCFADDSQFVSFDAFPDFCYVICRIIEKYPEFNLICTFEKLIESEKEKFYQSVTPVSFFSQVSDDTISFTEEMVLS